VNRQAGVPFDRIVPAVTVDPKGAEMSVSQSIPATVEIRRGRFIGLAAAIAVVTAAVTWIVLAYAFDNGSSNSASRSGQTVLVSGPSAAQDASRVPSIMSLTPARLAAHALGIGYALPEPETGPTVESVLASMSPATRRYTRAIMNLTFAQLAAGAAGQP
jgi:hypothetical protein